MKTVHVVLIRHCETEENVKAQYLKEGLQRIRQWRIPTWQQLNQAARLVALDTDSKPTALGKRQIAEMALTLQEVDLWNNFPFDVCAYSPLERAKETCLGLIPENLHSKCQPLELLKEIELYEHAVPFVLKTRIAQLEAWIMDQNKESIVLVGHSRYFHKLLQSKTYMWNCDVWQTAFVYDPVLRTGSWHTSTLLFRSPLARAHPIESIFASLRLTNNTSNNNRNRSTNNTSTREGEGSSDSEEDSSGYSSDPETRRRRRETQRHNRMRRQTAEAAATGDVHYEEPMCRICQVK